MCGCVYWWVSGLQGGCGCVGGVVGYVGYGVCGETWGGRGGRSLGSCACRVYVGWVGLCVWWGVHVGLPINMTLHMPPLSPTLCTAPAVSGSSRPSGCSQPMAGEAPQWYSPSKPQACMWLGHQLHHVGIRLTCLIPALPGRVPCNEPRGAGLGARPGHRGEGWSQSSSIA